jgi:hypothetical protein
MIERTCCSPNCREQTDTGNSELQDLSANSYQNLPGGFSMSSRTRIVVLHMKEIIYTAIFAALAILLIILLIVMFRPSGNLLHQERKSSTLRESILPHSH